MTAAAPQTGDISWAVTEEKVWTALQRLIAAADPVKIVAFGSRARGTAREDSDLDLAVILPAETVLRDTSLWATVSGLNMTVDLILANENRHERFCRSINSIHYDIDHEGVLLYEKGADATPDRVAVAKICMVRERDIDQLRQVWRQAMQNTESGVPLEELFDRLEEKYQALANSPAGNE